MRYSTFFASIALATAVSAQSTAVAPGPPGCLLAAINYVTVGTTTSPSDFKTLCGDKANKVQGQIQSICPSEDVSSALSAFSSSCKDKSYTVSAVTANNSTSPSTTVPHNNSTSASTSESGRVGVSGSMLALIVGLVSAGFLL